MMVTIRRAGCSLAGLLVLLLAPTVAPAQSEKPLDVTGDWLLTVETPEGNFTSTLKLERRGEGLSGRSIGREGKESKLKSVRLAGKRLSFEQTISYKGEDLHLVYTGLLDGDRIKGTFETQGLTLNWTAHRPTVSAAALAGVTGTWTITMETPGGSRERSLVLKQDGIQLTGTLTGFRGEAVPLASISLNGKELRFAVSSERNGVTVKRTYVAALDGNSMKGTIEGGGPSLTFTGKREAAPPLKGAVTTNGQNMATTGERAPKA